MARTYLGLGTGSRTRYNNLMLANACFLMGCFTALLFAATPPATFVLAPACGEKLGDEKFATLRSLEAARNSRKWDEAAALKQKLIADECGNVKLWLELAELFLEAKNQAQALAVLDSLADKGIETVPETLAQTNLKKLQKLVREPDFRSTSTYQKLYFHNISQLKRREEFLKTERATASLPEEKELKKTACPHACCQLGDWTSTQEVPLLAAPGSAKIIATVDANETVRSLEAEFKGKPQPIGIVADITWPAVFDKKSATTETELTLKKGEVLHLLEPIGDGFHRVFYKKNYYVTETIAIQALCRSPGASCWGEILDDQGDAEAQWWVKVRRSANRGEGWTNASSRFLRGCE